MTSNRSRGEEVRRFILEQAARDPSRLARATAQHFGISRQAVAKHIRSLMESGLLAASGRTRLRRHARQEIRDEILTFAVTDLDPEAVWRDHVRVWLAGRSEPVQEIWRFGLLEMLNNVLLHAQASHVWIAATLGGSRVRLIVGDDGQGLFEKIQSRLGLTYRLQAVLELAKGPLTSPREGRPGAGIFLTSRLFDLFTIRSRELFYARNQDLDWDGVSEEEPVAGTFVWMELADDTPRTLATVLARYRGGDAARRDLVTTVIPVELARFGAELLTTREQAERLMARVERFRTVVLNFKGVKSIGPGFAEHVFRTFPRLHPDVELLPVNCNEAVTASMRKIGFTVAPDRLPPPL
ncbi:MAG: DUF4325 domain-containing protein [Magnetococcales bacterium]|nr:DUF4325 domain-containing protein [Magnetococcales bacterium]